MDCLVIAAKSYNFKNDAQEQVSGTNVYYLDPVMREDSPEQTGLLPLKVPALATVFAKLLPENLPGIYELDFRQRPDSKGRPILTLADVKFKTKVKM